MRNRAHHTHSTDQPRSPDEALARIAAQNLGVVLRSEAHACGLTDDQLANRRQRGLLIELFPGVFRYATTPDGRPTRILAAVKAAGIAALACRQTALEPYEIHVPAHLVDEAIHVLVKRGNGPTPRDVIVHQTRQLLAVDAAMVGGIPVTSMERTLCDLAGIVPWKQMVDLVDEAVGRRLTTARRVHQRARQLTHGRAGCRRLAEFTGPGGPARLRSWLERWSRDRFLAAGLPPFEWNVVLTDRRGRVGEVDAVLSALRIAVELDGPRFHSTPAQRRKDRERDRRLQLDGWIVLRFEWADAVHGTETMIADIREAIAARQLNSGLSGFPRA